MPTASGGHRPTIEPDSRSETSCLLPLAGRVEGEQLLSIETEKDSSKRRRGQRGKQCWFGSPIGAIEPRHRVLLGPPPNRGGSCSLGERGTMKVVGRVRGEAIVSHPPTW